jgi:hypothetical protein
MQHGLEPEEGGDEDDDPAVLGARLSANEPDGQDESSQGAADGHPEATSR